MTSSEFTVDEYYELLALHRALMEARFCEEPNDNDISGSPIVASLHERLVEKLIEVDVVKKGARARAVWVDWLNISEDRREWVIALNRARSELRWNGWNNEAKRKYSRSLLAPFSVTDVALVKFIEQV